MLLQILARRTVFLDRSRRRNVVGGDAVAEHRQHARSLDLFHWRRLQRHVIEIRSAADIGGIFLPGIGLALGDRKSAPALVALEDVSVAFRKHVGSDSLLNCAFHFLLRRPDVGKINRLAFFIFADRVLAQVNVDAPCQRERHHQRRRHQIVGANLRVDSTFKVAIPGEHGSNHQIFFFNGLRNFVWQRTGVADASRASVAHNMKLQLLQIRHQLSLLQIVAHHFRSRRQRGLHPRRHGHSFLDRFLRQQTSGHHHRGI